MVRRVAVIGAGSSGLACIKICVDEGLEPVCFERSDDIGGLWKFKESPEPERSSIYWSLVVNTSKEMMCFSDFPMPDNYSNYMHNSQLLQYFRLYAEHFDLLSYINFKTTVRRVAQRSDFSVSGQWDIVTINKKGEEEKHIFDAVLVCSGHYTHPALPLSNFQGHDTFCGRCLHSWEYKDADACRGKRVVVVGIGNSGGDIAVEISRSAEKTFLSTRQGAWVLGRMSSDGLPLDMTSITRFINFLTRLLPKSLVNWAAERALNHKYDHRLYGLKPRHSFFFKLKIVNDDLPSRILLGRIRVKPNVREFCDTRVVFVDGSTVDKVDTVVFATGYNYSFPFLPPELQAKCDYRLRLYKHVFPPTLTHSTLAVVGFIHGLGAINPLAEMQVRWATRVFKGLISLPAEERMMKEIEKDTATINQSFKCSERNPLQVDYLPYMDSLAKEVGVKPNILRLFLNDPKLALQAFLGPCTPYQYRLSGPGQWDGARQAILTQWERVIQPFRTKVVPEPETRTPSSLSIIMTFSGAALLCLLYHRHILSSWF
ncbi:flavin-containing monooxygenase 5-like [Odontesthes bonariensis]|uniref:flavin-containing monooxygenase 5-like n=1 Tax=Odontesthes bonariensis TaxID=219752 RepID=UPI003F5854CA